ncbi:MAG TPA: symmetrical bis(5'-nucleosyl)-tetraphosphatase, partial [Gammaproteobacteria bacterium]|nr:symmetrical bis(5'-nucleosyl)-tetraphosphatase [Gammaproteobacteria bacterium]
MTVYAIGDIQGCFNELKQLLKKIKFSTDKDKLWITGDLVNRGPDSLATLRYIKSLEDNAITVLGNHDLHMLAVIYGLQKQRSKDTFSEILQAPDRELLVQWITQQPLMHIDETLNAVLVHAGIYPGWDITKARKLAIEVENTLQSEQLPAFLQHMYGNQPDKWNDDLTGWARLRFITNVFTRMRYCTDNFTLDLR